MTFFGDVLTILAWTKFRLVTKHVLSITHFHSCFFLTFPFKFYLYKKFKLSIKDYLLLIYTFMCMIIFLRIIILSFQNHQTRILSAGLGMVWNRYGLSCIKVHIYEIIDLANLHQYNDFPLDCELFFSFTFFYACFHTSPSPLREDTHKQARNPGKSFEWGHWFWIYFYMI